MKIGLMAATLAAGMVACGLGDGMASAEGSKDIRPWADAALVGRTVDIAPWTFEWRGDRAVQEKPEAYFIPRRLERLDRVYRTAYGALPQDQLKSWYYDMPELLKPLHPKPEGALTAGLLWVGGLTDYEVELQWPQGKVPAPGSVEVRVYPTAFGWFGWTVDQILTDPKVSADRRTWTYKSNVAAPGTIFENGQFTYKCGTASGTHAATEMVAVFRKGAKEPVVPAIRVVSPSVGVWERTDVEIEWGFEPGTEKTGFDGRIESHMAMTGPVHPLDTGTVALGSRGWTSKALGGERRGVVIPVLHTSVDRPGLDSRVTVLTGKTGFTFKVSDLKKGPIYIPEHGVFITQAGSGQTARAFVAELASKGLKDVAGMTREHAEVSSWDELMRKVRLSTCAAGTQLTPFPKVDDPPMDVQLSDAGWTQAWRAVSFQLTGPCMWGGLAWEAARTAHDMDLIGRHAEAQRIYTHFLRSPGVRTDGDYVDGDGCLEWGTDMKHDMGYSHDATHAQTGRLLLAMADHYMLTGDVEWFRQNRARMQEAADWIIRQRTLYLKDIPNRQDLQVAGLMPVRMWGDYAIPSCDWRWYYLDDAFSLQGLQRFADALTRFYGDGELKYKDESVQYNVGVLKEIEDQPRKYRDAAEAYRADIRAAVDREATYSPVRLTRDGTYRSYIPIAAYTRGTMLTLEMKAPQRPQCDSILGSLPLAEMFGPLAPNDPRVVDTLEVMEETGTTPTSGDAWFWNAYGGQIPKLSHNANIYLLQDDIPNFLRFWENSYALMIGSDGRLWEWGRPGDYSKCEAPDNGSAGWFMECFRNLLVMEDGRSLWVARATPRSWLEQGKKISVKNAPTYFGTTSYEIVSDVDHGAITATIDVPSGHTADSLIVRFRHPKSAPMKGVTVNGQAWIGFDPAKETITLTGFSGKTVVVASY